MQHTYRISKAAPIFSYLPRFIKIVRADFETSANMPKHPLINYPPMYRLLHKTPKNRISVLVFFHIKSFILIPLVLSSPATVTEYTVHTIFLKNHFFGLLGPRNVKINQNLNIDFFHDDNTFPIGKVKMHSQTSQDEIFAQLLRT